jgi:hypothetical protein
MSDRYTRITVPLSQDEFYALRDVALREYRHPREQARYLLRRFLLGSEDLQIPKNGNSDAHAFQAASVAIVPVQ